ncbi:hypothetical protein ACYPKM_04265 [Pseudomonas aeruginosa]
MLIAQVVVMSLACVLVFFICQKLKRQIQLVIAFALMAVGVTAAVMIGTTTELVLPGIGGIAIGAVAGGLVGYLTSAVVGTLGVVTGGIGFALGSLAMAGICALLGAVGASAGGFGIRVTQTWVIALPVIIVGAWMIVNRKEEPAPAKLFTTPEEAIAHFSREIGVD